VYLATYVDAAEGGVEIGGSAGDLWGFIDAAEGGVEIGGSAGDHQALTDGAEGGVEIGGSAGDHQALTDGAEGGVEIGGEVGDVWPSSGPAPGADCASAPRLTLGVTYTWAIDPSAPAAQSWVWVGATGIRTLTVTGFASHDAFGDIYTGADCSESFFITNFDDDGAYAFVALDMVQFQVQTANPRPSPLYTFRLD